MPRGLKKREMEQLQKATEALPEGLLYLRSAILDFARQDQELLGCGEANYEILIGVWRDRINGSDDETARQRAAYDAEALERWLKELPDPEAKWLGSAWFMVGTLRGLEMWWDGAAALEPAAPPAPAYQVVLTPPPAIKLKPCPPYGWEVKGKSFDGAILLSDEDLFHSLSKDWAFTASPNFPRSPGVKAEVMNEFVVGEARGARRFDAYVDQDQPFSASYLLMVPGGFVDVRTVVRGKNRSFDPTELETMLSTVRVEKVS